MSDPLAFGAPAEETTDLVDLQLGAPVATGVSEDPLFGGAPPTTTAAAAPAADPLFGGGGGAAVAPAVVETPSSSAWDAFAGAPAPVAAAAPAPVAPAPAPAVAPSAAFVPAAPAFFAPVSSAAAPAPAPAPRHQHQQQSTPLLVVQVSDPVRREAPGGAGFFGAATGGGAHVEYLVTTATSAPGGLPGWRAPTVSVRRRFRDAVALADLLKATHRGYFVPPRPDKNPAEGGVSALRPQSDAFIEERRATLERWLNRLAAHPAVGASDALRVFLEGEGDLSRDYRWLALQPPPAASVLEGASRAAQQLLGRESRAVDPVAAAQPASRSMDLLRAVREAATAARAATSASGGGGGGGSLASSAYMGQAGGGAGAGAGDGGSNGHAYGGGSALLREAGAGGAMPEGEAALRAARARQEDVKEALAAASRAAEALVAAQDECAQGAAELGAALFRLARLEEGAPGSAALAAAAAGGGGAGGGGGADDAAAAAAAAAVAGALVTDPKRTAGACVRAGKLRERAVARATADLGKLHEWLALMPAAARGLASREHQLLTAATLADDLAQRRAQLAALEGGMGAAAPRRAEELRADAARLELSCAAARREYDRLAAVNRAELARTARERSAELGAMLEGVAATQAAAAERALEIWLGLGGELRCAPERLAPLRSALTTSMGPAAGGGGGAI